MTISYRQISAGECMILSQDMVKDHWKEVAMYKDKVKIDPDYALYHQLEEAGSLKVFAAFDDIKLIGYFVVICRTHIHYKSTLYGYNDLIYVLPAYRGTDVGSSLIQFAEKCLREDGVGVMVVNTKTSNPFDSLLVREGFDHAENLYTKFIG